LWTAEKLITGLFSDVLGTKSGMRYFGENFLKSYCLRHLAPKLFHFLKL